MIYVGIDDTDVQGAPGTNQLARTIIRALAARFKPVVAIRHQLLVDPRVPYTSKNSAASILFDGAPPCTCEAMAERIRPILVQRAAPGSDPGLCVAEAVPEEITAFGRRCQREVVGQEEARRLANHFGLCLEGLGGTEDGVIGALSAIGLAAGGNDGRVVAIADRPDDISGVQEVARLLEWGVAELRRIDTDATVSDGQVDVGKHLRPSFRGGRIVLYVEAAPAASPTQAQWRAVRLP